MPTYKYHNYKHAINVYNAVKCIGEKAQVIDDAQFLLCVAALLHDVIYVHNKQDNEEKSCAFAEKLLCKFNFKGLDILIIKKLIMATKMPVKPKTKLEKIICDADIFSIGTAFYFKGENQLRRELKLNKKDFYSNVSKSFFSNFKWHTSAASELAAPYYLTNKKKVLELINYYSDD
jgi:predicted metal-dependent HD superfamily phosphohydrolase